MEREERKEIMKKSRFSGLFSAHFVGAAATAADLTPREELRAEKPKNLSLSQSQRLPHRPQVRLGPGMASHGE